MSTDTTSVNDQNQELKMAIVACVNAMYRLDGERTFINETVKKMKKDLDINPKAFRKAVKAAYKQNLHELEAETEEVTEILTKTKLIKVDESGV